MARVKKTFCQCCDRSFPKPRVLREGQKWTGHPLRQGECGLSGLTALYTRSGEMRGIIAGYRTIDGERKRKYFPFDNACKQDVLKMAEIWRLKKLREYHNDCLTVINKGIWERG